MTPLEYIPATYRLQQREYYDNLHFFPGVTVAFILWRTIKCQEFLPAIILLQPQLNPEMTTAWSYVAKDIMQEYPTGLDGQI